MSGNRVTPFEQSGFAKILTETIHRIAFPDNAVTHSVLGQAQVRAFYAQLCSLNCNHHEHPLQQNNNVVPNDK